MKTNKILSLLGLAKKAGKLKSGEFCVETEIKKGRALLVIVAEDSSDNTKKKYKDMCTYRNVPMYYYSTKDELGHFTGAEHRSAVVLLDEGFTKALIKELENNQSNSEVVE